MPKRWMAIWYFGAVCGLTSGCETSKSNQVMPAERLHFQADADTDEPPAVDSINKTNFKEIRTGMSVLIVEAILGRKGDEEVRMGGTLSNHCYYWRGATATIMVEFGGDGRVVGKEFTSK